MKPLCLALILVALATPTLADLSPRDRLALGVWADRPVVVAALDRAG